MDIDRLGTRNLGRDDRIVSDHGKEIRYPFLDEQIVSFLNSLHINDKIDFRYPPGKGDKILLRLLAYNLGFRYACYLPKRAIQFGSKTAKLDWKLGKDMGNGFNKLF